MIYRCSTDIVLYHTVSIFVNVRISDSLHMYGLNDGLNGASGQVYTQQRGRELAPQELRAAEGERIRVDAA